MIKLEKIDGKRELLGHPDQEKIYSSRYNMLFKGGKMSFVVDELQELDDFEGRNKFFNFSNVLDELGITESKYGFGFKSSDGLQLYVCENEGYLAFVAAGETQPALYKLILEGVYKVVQD